MSRQGAPLAIDLCCGLGGWTEGLLRAGFRVIGFDIEHPPSFPEGARFVQQDIRTIHARHWRANVTLIVASPPCTAFSQIWRFARNKERRPSIEWGLDLIHHCWRIRREARAPMVLENVYGAQDYIGPSARHVGPYHLWGDVPPLMPQGDFVKGIWSTEKGRSTNAYCDAKKRPHYVRDPRERARIPLHLASAIAHQFIGP